MKKLISILLVIVMLVSCVSLLSACDDSSDSKNPDSTESSSTNGNQNSSNDSNSNNNNNNTTTSTPTAKAEWISNRSISYVDDENGYRFCFALKDKSENYISCNARVEMSIVNELGETVYSGTKTVTASDYGEWYNIYEEWFGTAVCIYDNEITAGLCEEGTFYYKVITDDNWFEYSLEIYDLPTYTPSFSVGDKWTVNGEWELTITNIELHNGCESSTDLAQYVLITYTYKNLGNSDSAGLAFTEYDFNVYDSNGNLASSSYCWEHVKVAEYIDEGTSCTASIVYGFENSTNTIKIVAEKYDSDYNTIKATFNGTITTCEHKIVTDKGYSATCEAAGLTDGSHCSKCGTVITKQTTIPKKEHSWTTATCTTARKCSGCGYSDGTKADHNYSNGQCTSCGKSDSSYTYSVGQKWIVDGQWEFTITSVTRHRLCNSYSNSKYGYTDEDVILIEYSYKNIGYDGELYITAAVHFNVYDADGNVLSRYACTHNGYPQDCIVGTSCSGASEAYISEIKGASAKIHITLYTDDSRKMTATYVVPIT